MARSIDLPRPGVGDRSARDVLHSGSIGGKLLLTTYVLRERQSCNGGQDRRRGRHDHGRRQDASRRFALLEPSQQ